MLHLLMKGIVQPTKKGQKHQPSVKNVMLMSAKSVSSNIIIIVIQEGNTLYDILVMKVAFSSFYFVFRVFLLTFDLFQNQQLLHRVSNGL